MQYNMAGYYNTLEPHEKIIEHGPFFKYKCINFISLIDSFKKWGSLSAIKFPVPTNLPFFIRLASQPTARCTSRRGSI
jgi:hypothetical protein